LDVVLLQNTSGNVIACRIFIMMVL